MNEQANIAIIIISYNRAQHLLELLQNISLLEGKELLREVVVVNNRSTESYQAVEEFISSQPALPFRYFVAEKNLGVSAGRNFAIRQSTAPLLLFLDDDALFQNSDALLQVKQIFEEDGKNERPLGIAAFKVYYQATGQLQQTAFPHKQFHSRKALHRFNTYYFAGCAHGVRSEVFSGVGYYPEDFFYGMEEYDLSYRTLQAGYRIAYDDRVVVLHKESPQGRLAPPEKLRGMWVNKCTVAWKYLPEKFFYSTAFLWSLEYLKKTGFDLKGWIKGWKQVAKIPSTQKRLPLNAETMHYLKQVEARLFY